MVVRRGSWRFVGRVGMEAPMQDSGPDLNTGLMTPWTEDAFVEVEGDGKAAEDSQEGSMIEHPVFVFWCVSCSYEAPEECQPCPRCGACVRRHQRVLELPDEDAGSLSLASLRAALADISVSHDLQSSAMLLSEQGPDPSVASTNPAMASELAALGVPPAVQRALVKRGFSSLEQITAAATSAPMEGALGLKLGLSPAAEVLLRRLWHAAAERRAEQERAVQRRRPAESLYPRPGGALPSSPQNSDDDVVEDVWTYGMTPLWDPSAKRLRAERCDSSLEDSEEMEEEPPSEAVKRKQPFWDDLMQAIEDEGPWPLQS